MKDKWLYKSQRLPINHKWLIYKSQCFPIIPNKYSQLIFDEESKQYNGKKQSFQHIVPGKLDSHLPKTKTTSKNPYHVINQSMYLDTNHKPSIGIN